MHRVRFESMTTNELFTHFTNERDRLTRDQLVELLEALEHRRYAERMGAATPTQIPLPF